MAGDPGPARKIAEHPVYSTLDVCPLLTDELVPRLATPCKDGRGSG